MRKGDVLFAKRNAYLKRVAIAPHDGLFSAHGMVLRANPDLMLHEFLPFFMQSERFWDRAIGISVGSLSPTINWTTLATEEFALPPIEEQRRMVAVLAASEASMSAIFDAATAINAVRLSIFKTHFLEARSKTSSKRIGDVAAVSNGSTPSRGRRDYWGGTIPWLPTGKVNERRITKADEWITDAALAECPLRVIPSGSTLVAMIGQGATRGRAALLEIDATINQNFAAVIPGAEVSSKFLFYQLEALYEHLRHVSQGSNQLALNCQLISNVVIHVPSAAEQHEVVTRLDRVEDAIDALGVRKRAADGIRRQLVGQVSTESCG
jgi:type I restriction enzyme S subunit